jgi:hypothetical protein
MGETYSTRGEMYINVNIKFWLENLKGSDYSKTKEKMGE